MREISEQLKRIPVEIGRANTKIDTIKQDLAPDERRIAEIVQETLQALGDGICEGAPAEAVENTLEKLEPSIERASTKDVSLLGAEVELLTAPSIRHCGNPNGPQPLAEDVAGVIGLLPDHLIGYVADGAPGPEISNLLSSRIHARIMGHDVFLEWAVEALKEEKIPRPGDEEHLKREIIQRMTQKLQEALGQGFRENLERRREDLPKFDGRSGLQWQVSFTGILLNVRTCKLHLFQIGDTAACVGVKSGIEIEKGEPLFTTLLLGEQSVDFKFTFSPAIRIFENVQGVVAMSDGVFGKSSTLRGLRTMDFEELVKNLRKMPIPSRDDKALLIISLPKL